MKVSDAYWYRYISFDPMKIGSARIVKNSIFGMGVEQDTSRFAVWFANSNEKVFVEYDDVQQLDAASRPYNGKINGVHVRSGVTAKTLLAEQGRAASNTVVDPSDLFKRPTSSVKEKAPDVPDQRPVDVLREMLKDYPYVYGLPLRPYDSNLVVDEPHIYMTRGEWYSLGNDHEEKYCRHGVVCYAQRIGVDDAKSFDMHPLTKNTLSKSAWESTVEDWLMSMVSRAEILIYERADKLTSRTIREFTEGWMRSKMFSIKHDLSREHMDWVESESVSKSKWLHMSNVFEDIRHYDIEAWLQVLASPISEPELIFEVEDAIIEYLKTEDANMTLELLDEWMDIIKAPSRRLKFAYRHRYHLKSFANASDEDLDNFDLLEDATWEVSIERIKKKLTAWIEERGTPATPEQKNEVLVSGTLPNRPVISNWRTPFPLTVQMTTTNIETGSGGTIRPCTDARITELVAEIMPLLGNKIPMRLDYLVWGIGSSTSMITYSTKAKQILSINPAQIEQIYGRCDLDTLGSAITHEMGHYALNQVVKNSDVMKFKRDAAGINLHSSQNNASGSTYPFYHEQFAMLCEYGVWGTCARGLQSLKGWDIVNKYFNITPHITQELIKTYKQ